MGQTDTQKKDCILVIDQGTQSSRCIIFDANGKKLACTKQPVSLRRHSSRHIEQDGAEILRSVETCLQNLPQMLLSQTGRCAMTGQRSSFLLWDRQSLRPLTNILSWQDTSSASLLKQFKQYEAQIKNITGLPLSAHYGAGKILSLLKMHKQKDMQNILATPLMSFLLDNLVQDPLQAIDHTNAHRSLLFDLHDCSWSQACLDMFSIPASVLPDLRPVKSAYGYLKNSCISLDVLLGDQNAAVFSQAMPGRQRAFINVGTGAFVLSLLDRPHTDSPLLCSLLYSTESEKIYALEATVNGAGAALSWLQTRYPVDDLYSKLADWLENIQQLPVFMNGIGSLGSPWWCAGETFFIGDDRDIPANYVALIESIVFMLVENLRIMQQYSHLTEISISGGLSLLDGLCQKLANLSGLEVRRNTDIEATARGAAWLASEQAESWCQPEEDVFIPHTDSHLFCRFEIFCSEIQQLKQKQLHLLGN